MIRAVLHRIHAAVFGYGYGKCSRCGRFYSFGLRRGVDYLDETRTRWDMTCCPGRALRGVVIENRDACEVMESQDSKETLHYVDTPYVHSTRKGTKSGYRFEMTDMDHRKLISFISGLSGMVLLSGYENPIYADLGWQKETLETRVFHQGNATTPRTEILWMNAAAIKAQSQQSFFT
jgi:DNA adenine methylase